MGLAIKNSCLSDKKTNSSIEFLSGDIFICVTLSPIDCLWKLKKNVFVHYSIIT